MACPSRMQMMMTKAASSVAFQLEALLSKPRNMICNKSFVSISSSSSYPSSSSEAERERKMVSESRWTRKGVATAFDFGKDRKGSSLLTMEEVMQVLEDVKAQDVKNINVHGQCDWTDSMVLASGRSKWHVQNIAQALIYRMKQKQRGLDKTVVPRVEGREGGKWLLLDIGRIIIHILDEDARSYYNLESLWTNERVAEGSNEKNELENVLKGILPKSAN